MNRAEWIKARWPGPWMYCDADYPEEGGIGPFNTLAEATAHAAGVYSAGGSAMFIPLSAAEANALEAAPHED